MSKRAVIEIVQSPIGRFEGADSEDRYVSSMPSATFASFAILFHPGEELKTGFSSEPFETRELSHRSCDHGP